MATIIEAAGVQRTAAPSFAEALHVWLQIGCLSFGGPTAQIALMHRIIVEQKKWLDEERFLGALSFCMLLPGPEAMQLATYAGWRLHGVIGGLAAGLLFVLPGAVVVLALSAIYAGFGNVPVVEALFFGVKAAVLVIVVEALLRIARRALKGPASWLMAAASFVAIFFLALPYPLIVLTAAIIGALIGTRSHPSKPDISVQVRPLATLQTVLIGLLLWLGPLILLTLMLGHGNVLSELGWFFSKLAVVTFGGAYAVLAYMGQDVVTAHGWLEAGQMMDGLGLAETTPGPLILVTEFVGFVAAFQESGGRAGSLGLAGALVALWATFAPCFLWIFAGAPYIEWINAQRRLRSALAGITAAVVGVIVNLSLWFGLHVFFGDVQRRHAGPLQFWMPDVSSIDAGAVILAVIAGYFLLWRHWSIPAVLGVAAASALAVRLMPV